MELLSIDSENRPQNWEPSPQPAKLRHQPLFQRLNQPDLRTHEIMTELKTQKTSASVQNFIAKLKAPTLEADCQTLCSLMAELTGSPATMWGKSIVGFGSYRYTYASGKSGDWMEIGFSPRKQNLTIYLMCGIDTFDKTHQQLLQQIGPHSCGSSCLYVKRLADLDTVVLKKLLTYSISQIRTRFPASTTSDNKPSLKKKTIQKIPGKKTSAKKITSKKNVLSAAPKKSVKKSKRSK